MLDHLEPIVAAGGCVIDYHSCGLFPERWIQLVVVLRASTEALVLSRVRTMRGASSEPANMKHGSVPTRSVASGDVAPSSHLSQQQFDTAPTAWQTVSEGRFVA